MRKTIRQFVREFNNKKVFYDPSFQRRVVWDKDDINKYFVSLTRGWPILDVVLADVEQCLEYSRLKGDLISEKYFDDIHCRGFKYISLDGQNRTKSILAVMDNKNTLTGEFRDADDQMIRVENVFFKDLPQRLQDRVITGCDIKVELSCDSLQSDLPYQFEALNAGVPLNAQEHRNAIQSPIAGWIRETSKYHEEAILRFTQKDDIKRMTDDENIAKLAMVLLRDKSWALDNASMDEWYKLGIGFNSLQDDGCPYKKVEIHRVESIFNMFCSVMNHQKLYPPSKMIPKRLWWGALYLCAWIDDNNLIISSQKDFFEKLKEIDDGLVRSSELTYATDCDNDIKNGGTGDIKKDHYYFKWATAPHHPIARYKRRKALIDEAIKNKSQLSIRQQPSHTQSVA